MTCVVGTQRFNHPTRITTDNMAKYSKKHQLSEKSKDDAMKIARGTQRPGQTKEQTKLIAQGIQKGIEIYKKKHGEKARELNKKLHKASASAASGKTSTEQNNRGQRAIFSNIRNNCSLTPINYSLIPINY